MQWHLITPEFPPQLGGVSDYTAQLADGLASAGEEVHVWCPGSEGTSVAASGVTIHRTFGAFAPADLKRAGSELDRFPQPRHLLVQWVPHGFGYRGMNVAFSRWLWQRARVNRDVVELMAHEAYLRFARNWRQCGAAFVQRLMTVFALRAASRVWMSIPEWESRFQPYVLGRRIPFYWLPIPSSIPVENDANSIAAVKQRYSPRGEFLIGHFGTYGWPITSLLEPILTALADPRPTVLLMGGESDTYRAKLIRNHPQMASYVHATGALVARDISFHLAACDVMIQPYPDGASSRRGSLMAPMAHGKAVVTTSGTLTAQFWKESDALAMAPAGEPEKFVKLVRRLEENPEERRRLGQMAAAMYKQRFDISQIIERLRESKIQSANSLNEREIVAGYELNRPS